LVVEAFYSNCLSKEIKIVISLQVALSESA